ncbi:hypothetical protein LCGC14_1117310, partial [marine sediment metagenome]
KSTVRKDGIPEKWESKTFRGENFDALELIT